jgi:uroporphyrinogen decarboxylase
VNHKERFLAVLQNKKPDRVPILANLTVQAAQKLAPILNKEIGFIDSFLATRISHRDILLALGNDAVIIAPTRETPTRTLPNGDICDEWGIIYHTVGLYGEAVGRPLANCGTAEELNGFRMPDPDAPVYWEWAKREVAVYGNDYVVVGDLEACIFELAWNLVGLEKFLCDLMTDEDYVTLLLDRIESYSTKLGRNLIALGSDLIWAGDDFGTQNGMMISPELWRKHFKPRYERMFAEFKRLKPDVKIAYHSCGSIAQIIPEYIEIGLDFLNPIQPAAVGMDLGVLYDEYHDRLGFFGGVDVQNILPKGSTDDVRREVRRCMDATKKERFIIAPAHNIQPDTPVENILAFFDEAIHYGKL